MTSVDDAVTATAAGPGPRRAWLGMSVLLLPVLLVSMDISVLFLAMPTLSADLAPSAAQQLWILDIYGFLLAGLLITMGNLGDRIGRRNILLAGSAVFGIGSILAAFATGPEMLIAARALMGIGGATLLPSSLALISVIFPEARQRGVAIGVWTAFFAGGSAVGPVVGGFLLHHFWWGSVFLVNTPVLLVLLVAGPFLLPEHRAPERGRLDLRSVALSIGGILPAVYGVKHAAAEGVDAEALIAFALGVLLLVLFVRRQRLLDDPLLDLRLFANRTFSLAIGGILPAVYGVKHAAAEGVDAEALIAFALGVLLLVLFVRRQRLLDDPLLDLRLFANRTFSLAIGASLTGMMSLAALSYLASVYLQSITGRDPLAAAWLGIPMAVAVFVFSIGGSGIGRALGTRLAFVVALLASAVGNLMLLGVGVDGGVWWYVAGSALAGVGYGIAFTLVSDVSVSSVPPERAGSAAATSETSFELGNALGLALLGSLATAVFRASSGTSGTLGDELREAGSDAGRVATVQESFVTGMHTATTVGALLLVLMAAATWFFGPRKRATASEVVSGRV
ncbi:MFS transporter [Nocardia asteroides]|uniref:MFS transporter n=1 Tax=Nocardia asteroides TaxID=1824 RepID=UPI001E347AC3|nr:MFS transporter [Nocardia asteroides]UGT63139.1 MFS transporter [Nocardia asteroides]